LLKEFSSALRLAALICENAARPYGVAACGFWETRTKPIRLFKLVLGFWKLAQARMGGTAQGQDLNL
jgi:hypothetical protein